MKRRDVKKPLRLCYCLLFTLHSLRVLTLFCPPWFEHLHPPSSSSLPLPLSCSAFLCPLTHGSCVNVLSPRCVGLPLIVSLCCVVTTETLDRLQQLRLTHIQARTEHTCTPVRAHTHTYTRALTHNTDSDTYTLMAREFFELRALVQV